MLYIYENSYIEKYDIYRQNTKKNSVFTIYKKHLIPGQYIRKKEVPIYKHP